MLTHSNRPFLLIPWNTSRSTPTYPLPYVRTYVANSVTKSRKLPLSGGHDPVGDDFTRRVLHVDGRVRPTGNVVGQAVPERRVVNRRLCNDDGGSDSDQDEKPHHFTPMVTDGRWLWWKHKNKSTIQTRKIAVRAMSTGTESPNRMPTKRCSLNNKPYCNWR